MVEGGRWEADGRSEAGWTLMNTSNDANVRKEDEEIQLHAS